MPGVQGPGVRVWAVGVGGLGAQDCVLRSSAVVGAPRGPRFLPLRPRSPGCVVPIVGVSKASFPP